MPENDLTGAVKTAAEGGLLEAVRCGKCGKVLFQKVAESKFRGIVVECKRCKHKNRF